MNPYKVVDDFERALSEYTGAPYVVCVSSCTAALQLCFELVFKCGYKYATIPKRTYMSVPMAVKNAGGRVYFKDEIWIGGYQCEPWPIWDCARRFTSGMYRKGEFQCISFSSSKILGIEQGGAILHDNDEADDWFRRMRFDGRKPGADPMDDEFIIGHHFPMLPSIAAQAILKLHFLPKHNPDLPYYEYPDLSLKECFRESVGTDTRKSGVEAVTYEKPDGNSLAKFGWVGY